ncbi:hypothetical protein [Staphylococcus aureus]
MIIHCSFLSLKQIISSKLIVRKFKIFVDILKQI